jgi:hypothetical protein
MTGSLQMICQWGTDLTITNECDFHNWISLSAERRASGAANSGSDAGADAVCRRLHALYR